MGKVYGSGPIQIGNGRLGMQQHLPAQELHPEALWFSSNMINRNGVLRTRPGPLKIASIYSSPPSDPSFSSQPMGGFQGWLADGSPTLFVATRVGFWSFDLEGTGNWSDLSPSSALTGGTSDMARHTVIDISNSPQFVMTNGKDPLHYSNNGGQLTKADTTPDLPKFIDITTVADRLVGLYLPYGVRWAQPYTVTYSSSNWPSTNVRILSDTPGRVRAVRPIGTLGMVVYKEDSIWFAQAQGGPPSHAFRFEYKGRYDGPAGPSAVVEASGAHYYMTSTGRVGRFDGIRHDWVCDEIWPYIQSAILNITTTTDAMYGTYASYDKVHNEVHFHLPTALSSGGSIRSLCVSLPQPHLGKNYYSAFINSWDDATLGGISLGVGLKDTAWLGTVDQIGMVVLTSESPYVFVPSNSVGMTTASWQTPLFAVGDANTIELESYFTLGASHGVVTVAPYITNLLGRSDGYGTVGTAVTLDLTSSTNVYNPVGFSSSGRYIGFGYAVNGVSGSGKANYLGALFTPIALETSTYRSRY